MFFHRGFSVFSTSTECVFFYKEERDEEFFTESPLVSRSECRNIPVEGNTVTFEWAEVDSIFTQLCPTKMEVHDGKITLLDFYEDSQSVRTEEEK
jgi:hypothetical protein